jgi:hypothetical protein
MRFIHPFLKGKSEILKKPIENRGKVPLSNQLDSNVRELKEAFSYPANEDFVVRQLHIRTLDCEGALFFIDGMVNAEELERTVKDQLRD